MKYLGAPLLLLILIILPGCRSWDGSMVVTKKAPITPKLLTLDRRIEDLAATTIKNYENGFDIRLFTKEVEDNLSDPTGDKYGYIAMKRTIIKEREGLGFTYLSLYPALVPMLLGCPVMRPVFTIEVELSIMDRNNKLLGRYSAVGTGKSFVALYYGYSMLDGPDKSYVDAMNDAFNQIRPQIQADAVRINEKLLEAGKVL